MSRFLIKAINAQLTRLKVMLNRGKPTFKYKRKVDMFSYVRGHVKATFLKELISMKCTHFHLVQPEKRKGCALVRGFCKSGSCSIGIEWSQCKVISLGTMVIVLHFRSNSPLFCETQLKWHCTQVVHLMRATFRVGQNRFPTQREALFLRQLLPREISSLLHQTDFIGFNQNLVADAQALKACGDLYLYAMIKPGPGDQITQPLDARRRCRRL